MRSTEGDVELTNISLGLVFDRVPVLGGIGPDHYAHISDFPSTHAKN